MLHWFTIVIELVSRGHNSYEFHTVHPIASRFSNPYQPERLRKCRHPNLHNFFVTARTFQQRLIINACVQEHSPTNT